MTTIFFLSLMCLVTSAYPDALSREQANSWKHKDDFWQNEWDGPLLVDCGLSEAFYRVRSEHDNYKNDRRWHWYCKEVCPRRVCFLLDVKYACFPLFVYKCILHAHAVFSYSD